MTSDTVANSLTGSLQAGLQGMALQMINALIESGSIPEQTREWTCKINVQLFAPADLSMDVKGKSKDDEDLQRLDDDGGA